MNRVSKLVCACAIAVASWPAIASTEPTEGVVPSPLLAVDQNRGTVVARIVDAWGAALARSESGVTQEQLREMLLGLRSDYLIAAGAAGSLEGLRAVLASAVATDAIKDPRMQKVLGDANADLVYTPVTPCRLFDTRPSQGGTGNLIPGGLRTYGVTAAVPNQGGPGNCGAATGVAAALILIGTVAPSGNGLLQGGPQGVTSFPNALILFQPGDQYGTSVAMPLNAANGQFTIVAQFASTDVFGDLLGTFRPATGFVSSVATGTGLAGGPITTSGTISIAAGGVGSTQLADQGVTTAKLADGAVTTPKIAANGCVAGQILKFSGTAWACDVDQNSGGTVTAVTASTPLASTGGNTPNITLSSAVPVGSGGTGLSTLTNNAILFGQGTAPIGTAVGATGQLLAGSAGAPAWTGSPSISGNLTLVNTGGLTTGNIMKGANRFIHNAGSQNTFVGDSAGTFTVGGSANTGVGVTALNHIAAGVDNTAIGAFALAATSSGHDNTGVGASALQFNTIGFDNTATGALALQSNIDGSGNTANGSAALLQNNSGTNNTAIGVGALGANNSGGSNVAVGFSALSNNASGNSNIAIGRNAGLSLTTGDNNIVIGSNSGVSGEANTIRIGSGFQTRTFIGGINGVTTGGTGVAVLVDPLGQLGTISSSRRFKEDIVDMGEASSELMKLRPVTFHYKSDHDATQRTLHYGLVAEEVASVDAGLVARGTDGTIDTVLYQFLPPMLLNEAQKQRRLIEAQTMSIAAQAARIEELEQDRRRQTARIDALEQQAIEFAALRERFLRADRLIADLAVPQ